MKMMIGHQMLFKDVLLHIIELFNRNECFLLRDMYHFYCERIGFHFKDDIDMLTSEKKTSNWLLLSLWSTFYHMSPKRRRGLEELAEVLREDTCITAAEIAVLVDHFDDILSEDERDGIIVE